MFSLLANIFIKDKDNVRDAGVRRSYGMLSGILGIALNIILFVGKYIAGVLSSSIAITADAFNNLSDAGSSLVTFIGFRFSGMKPDKDHPFGHGRIEYISAFVVSLVIILMGFELGKESVQKVISPSPVETGLLPVIILVCSVLVKLYMYYYNHRYGTKLESSVMKATSIDSLSDSLATTVVLASMLVAYLFKVNVDGWCGIIVALFILYAGFSTAKETIGELLGKAPSKELVDQIESIVMSHDEIIGIHDLVVHDYGPGRLIISLHGEVSSDGDLLHMHDAIDHIEYELNEKLNCESIIHMDPIDCNDENVVKMRQSVTDFVHSIDPRITVHDFRMVSGPTHTNLIFDVVVPYGFTKTDAELKKQIQDMVSQRWENHFCVITVDQPYV